MNSLEFINLEIAKAKSDYKKFINFGQTNFAIATEKRIKHLQQIKSELEAWEVVKDARKKLHFGFSYCKDIETNKIELIVSFTTEEKNKETLKKALEVEDDR